MELPPLTDIERATYEWQMWVPNFGEDGQRKLKNATAFISRIGGIGGTVAYYLAAAGIGRLIIAHAGNVRRDDLNRQILMTEDWLGKPRIESAAKRLRELNPRLEIVAHAENVTDPNAKLLISDADVIVSAAPLFAERFAMNAAAVAAGKPMVDCAMYEMQAQIFSVSPRRSPCFACVFPVAPETWKRQFPVFGAVSGTVACMGAMEVVKIISGVGTPLYGKLLAYDLGDMSFRRLHVKRDPACAVCGSPG
jgi:molybdopterin-synthase adenylyltransferase